MLRRFALCLALLCGLLAFAPSTRAQPTPGLDAAVDRSFHGPDAAGKDGPMARLGRKLVRVYHAHRQGRTAGALSGASRAAMADGGLVGIDAVASEDPGRLLDSLRALGLRRGAVAGRVVSGLLPAGSLDEAAGLSSLHRAAPTALRGGALTSGSRPDPAPSRGGPSRAEPPRAEPSPTAAAATDGLGITASQGRISLRADRTRSRFGTRGRGVKVCAISTSYDNFNGTPRRSAREDVSNGDLPGTGNPNGLTTPVEVVQESPTPNNDEGRAMLQIVHEIAPEARLAFLSPVGVAGFADGVRRLAQAGCSVITDDLTNYSSPMFQDGLISEAVDEVAQEEGVAYVNAAGNEADQSYAAAFSASGRQAHDAGINASGGLHDFDPSSSTDVRQRLRIAPGETALIGLQWDDPYYRVSGEPGADTDVDLYLLDGDTVIAESVRDNVGGDPFEVVQVTNESDETQSFDLAVVLNQGPEPGRLKYIVEGRAAISEHDTNSPTVFAHNDALSSISTAAAAWHQTPRVPEGAPASPTAPPLLNGYSSKGGTPLLFDDDGTRLAQPVRRNKPDVTAPDDGNTTFFGRDLPDRYDTDPYPNFPGTSAASPHLAGVVALMRGVRPELPVSQIEARLEQSAVDILRRGPSGRPSAEASRIPNGEGQDAFSGAGLVQADRAVAAVLTAQVSQFAADGTARAADTPTAPVSLAWTTRIERNSEGFVVERRPGPLSPEARRTDEGWSQVAFVPSKADNATAQGSLQYRYEGTVPTPGLYAFRLRHRTADSPEKGRRIGAATQVRVPVGGAFDLDGPFPNPTREQARFELVVGEEQSVRIALYDVLGRRVRVLYDDRLDARTPLLFEANTGSLTSGTYVLRVRGDAFSETRRMVVVR
jgi:hypothetical protein